MSASSRRRHDAPRLQKDGRRRPYPRPPSEPTPNAYLRRPPSTFRSQAALVHSPSLPIAANRPGEVVFPTSGSSGRRHDPSSPSATRASPSQFSSPRTPPPLQEPNPPLDFDREPHSPQNHSVTEAPSAAELAADEPLRPRRPVDHREDRLGEVDPSLASDALEEPPFTSDDRRSPASLGQRREKGRGDWSNLTSGPGGPTVSDPPRRHAC